MGSSIWRPAYNPTAEFVVSKKGLQFGGSTYKPGENFTVKTTDRQKRILYEGRFIDMKNPELHAAPTQRQKHAARLSIGQRAMLEATGQAQSLPVDDGFPEDMEGSGQGPAGEDVLDGEEGEGTEDGVADGSAEETEEQPETEETTTLQQGQQADPAHEETSTENAVAETEADVWPPPLGGATREAEVLPIGRATGEAKIMPLGRGYYNVVGLDGVTLNAEPMRLKEAEKFISQG